MIKTIALAIFLLAPLNGLLLGAQPAHADAVYQWSVRVPHHTGKRAYLWISPNCRRVRGLIFGVQNMLEAPMLADATIRKAAAQCGLGILWVAPGNIGVHDSGLCIGDQFGPPAKAGRQLQGALNRLAQVTGYTELRYAPLLVVGHSAAASLVYGMAAWDPARIIAIMPDKCGFPSGNQSQLQHGVPVFRVTSEWAEWGSGWGSLVQSDIKMFEHQRKLHPHAPMGQFVDVGTGHFDWNPASAPIIALFIKKAVEYRVPAQAPLNQPVRLKPVDLAAGGVIDITQLGEPFSTAVPQSEFKGKPSHAAWFFDVNLANAVNQYMAAAYARKPQMIDFTIHGKPAPLIKGGYADLGPQWNADGITFQVHAKYLNRSPTKNLFAGQTLGHCEEPIQFRPVDGAGLKQVGPNTFEMWLHRGGIRRQGNPWEPWVLAYSTGNKQYLSADRPAHFWVKLRNTTGRRQRLTFAPIANQTAGGGPIALHAVASSGLPVQFFVISGPVRLRGNTLVQTRIPPRAKFPMRVLVGAYQWGRVGANAIESAAPVTRQFLIQK